TPPTRALGFDMWIAALISVGIGEFATIFGERHRRELRDSAAALDASSDRLFDEKLAREQVMELHSEVQDQFRASQRLFELFMRQLPGPAFIRNSRGKYVYVNEQMVHFTNS